MTYFSIELDKQQGEGDCRSLEVQKQFFTEYTQEGYGAAKISIMLNQRGLKTKRGCRWSQNAVSHILRNELYTGKVINGKQIERSLRVLCL